MGESGSYLVGRLVTTFSDSNYNPLRAIFELENNTKSIKTPFLKVSMGFNFRDKMGICYIRRKISLFYVCIFLA